MIETLHRRSPAVPTTLALLAWLAAAIAAGISGSLTQPGPPLVLFAFLAVPALVGAIAYGVSPSFRAWTARLSLTWLVGLHLWRFVGLLFVLAWLTGDLPGGFAIPEGFGDAVAAAGALALLPGLRRGTASPRWVFIWNTFGLIDLLSAIVVGVLYSNGDLGILSDGGITTQLMVTFPVSLIPSFLVPLFILLHLLTFTRIAALHAPSRIDGPFVTAERRA